MRTTTDRRPSSAFRRAVALSALALLATLLAPALQSPAAAAPGDVDAGIVMVTPPPEGPLVVGRPFAFVVAHGYTPDEVEGSLVETTITYVVPDEFRVDGAEAVGNPDYYCEVDGQTVTCTWLAFGSVSNQVRFRLTPVALGDDVESTLSISANFPDPDPDPTPNEVSFTRDIVGSTVDLGAYLYASPDDAQVGDPVGFQTFVYTGSSGQVNQAIDATLVQQVPTGITIDDVEIIRPGFDERGNPLQPSGSCATSGQTVTCSGMDLTSDGQFIVVDGTATATGTFSSTASVSTNGTSQTEVSPDPTPNTTSATLEVDGTVLPSDVSGAVTDATGAAVVGATVAAFGEADSTTPTASATTTAGGAYTLAALPPGTYRLRLTPPVGSPLSVQWSGARTTRAGATTTVVSGAGDAITGVDQVLVDTDPTHVDLRADVFTAPESPLAVDEPVTIYYALTNAARQVDGSSVAAAQDIVAVAEVPAGFSISSATVADPNRPGEPVPGSCSTVGQTVTCTGLDAEVGGYRWVVVEATPSATGSGLLAELSLSSTSQDEVVVDPNRNTWSIPLRVSDGTDPSTVTGLVTDAGANPVAGVDVWAYLPSDGFVPPAGARTSTDANGRFSFPALAPGSYALRYGPPSGSGYAAQWSGGSSGRGGATPVVVDGFGAPVDVSEQLAFPVGSVSGTVRGPGAAPVAGVAVLAFQPGVFFFPAASTVTAADGSYTLSGLGQGSYEVAFRPAGGSGLGWEWFDDSPSRGAATPVEVFDSAVAVADADLVATGSMAGTVTGATGSPLAGTRVVLFAPSDTWAGSYEVVTAADGTYALPALPADTYRVRFVPPASSGLVPQWFDGVTLRAAATPVVVAGGGGASGIDATWVP